MSLNVVLYDFFNKRKNSTKTPVSGDIHERFACLLKDASSILHPVMSFNLPNTDDYNPRRYNYAYITEYSRYYFVIDWTWSDGLWWAEMEVDVLASWKQQIFSSSGYVVRAADTSIMNPSISDSLFPATFDISHDHETVLLFDANANSLKTGTIVMGVTDGGEFSRGGISYFCGKQSDFTELYQFMFSSTDWLNGANITDISNDLLKCLIDPAQYIKSMMWFPFDFSSISEEGGDAITVGWWNTDIHLMYAKSTIQKDYLVYRPRHPQGASDKSYLHYAPYTQLWCVLPCFGCVSLPAEKFKPNQKIVFSLYVDTVTGAGSVYIHSENVGVAEGIMLKGQVGVPLALSAMTSDILGAASTVTNAMANGTNSLAAATIGLVGGIADAAKLLSPDVTVLGGNGNISEYAVKGMLNGDFKKIVPTNYEDVGAPACTTKVLGTIQGFIQVMDIEIDYPCFSQEKDIIRDYMTKGFFIE